MLGVGIGVRPLGVAAAPGPPAPVPPGKPPLPLSSPDLSRRSSGWRFSNGNPTSATTSSRAARRKWWSDPEPDQQGYGYYGSSRLDDEEEDYDDEDEAGFPGFGGELFDEPWFTKVFKTYGYVLPVMLASMFVATGTKAFLMAMAIPLGQSAISFLLDAIWGRRRSDREDRWRRQTQPFQEDDDYTEGTADFAESGRGNGYNSRSNYSEGKRRQHSYQSWVSDDFPGATTATGADDNSTKRSSSGGGGGGKESGGGFGGWDELLDDDYAREKRSSRSFSAGKADYSKRSQPAATGQEEADAAAAAARGRVGQGLGAAAPARARGMSRRRRMPRTMGLSSSGYKQAPLLMRLLVAVFPFLGSWFRML